MNNKITCILAAFALFCGFSAEGAPEQRANASKVFRDVPYEFQWYDAVNSRMLYKDSLPTEQNGANGRIVNMLIEEENGANSTDETARQRKYARLTPEEEKELLQKMFTDHMGLTMPEGSRITYDERSGKFTIRSSKEDIRTVEKALADYKELERWFSKQLDDTNPITGTCYTNLNAVFLATVTDALLQAYSQDKKNVKSRKSKKKKGRRGAKQNKEEEVIAELDKKRALIFVFDKNVSYQKVMEFREQMKIKDCICVYESELSEGFAELQQEGSIVLVSCYGEVVDTFTSLNSIKSRVKDICFWHKKGLYRREYYSR